MAHCLLMGWEVLGGWKGEVMEVHLNWVLWAVVAAAGYRQEELHVYVLVEMVILGMEEVVEQDPDLELVVQDF